MNDFGSYGFFTVDPKLLTDNSQQYFLALYMPHAVYK